MKDSYNEVILLKFEENNKKKIFLECIKKSNSLYYLEKEDIINLSKCSKSINLFVNHNYFLLRNLLKSPQAR